MSASRVTLALFWIAAGVNHFANPKFYDAIMPPPFDRYARETTYASGVAELLGGVLVLVPGGQRAARAWLLVTLAAVYPANVWMALQPDRFKRIPRWGLYARLPVQFLFAWHILVGTRED